MSDPQIPAALAPVVKGIRLAERLQAAPHVQVGHGVYLCRLRLFHDSPTEPGTCYAMTPQDNQTIYNLNPLYNAGYSGQGQTIALVEDTDTYGGAGRLEHLPLDFRLGHRLPAGNLHPVASRRLHRSRHQRG